MKITLETLRQLKANKRKAAGVSCYTAPDAAIASQFVDFIVVGDSLAMTLLGFDSTLPATMDMMELFVAATRRGIDTNGRVPLIIGDMPLGSYQPSDEIAVINASRLVCAGADIVKIEGSSPLVQDRIQAITESGIGVMAHLGLQPQQKALTGGWKVQAKSAAEAYELETECNAVEEAGAVVTLVEAVPREVGAWLTERTDHLIYGIGAGPDVDGQLLVMSDLVGEFRQFKSRFAKRFAECGDMKRRALQEYTAHVLNGTFPDGETSYRMSDEEVEKLK